MLEYPVYNVPVDEGETIFKIDNLNIRMSHKSEITITIDWDSVLEEIRKMNGFVHPEVEKAILQLKNNTKTAKSRLDASLLEKN